MRTNDKKAVIFRLSLRLIIAITDCFPNLWTNYLGFIPSTSPEPDDSSQVPIDDKITKSGSSI